MCGGRACERIHVYLWGHVRGGMSVSACARMCLCVCGPLCVAEREHVCMLTCLCVCVMCIGVGFMCVVCVRVRCV